MSFEADGKLKERVFFTEEDIPNINWRDCHRTALTRARVLTEKDYEKMGGIINTLEGEASFKTGDYLAIGAGGELYPIRKDTMETAKEKVSESDDEGFAEYRSTQTVHAAQFQEPFATMRDNSRLEGKPDDYLLYREKSGGGVRMWIIDQDLFNQTYELVKKEEEK